MALIVVTQPGTTVVVSNGDKVILDIPGGGDVTIVAANANVRRVTVEYGSDSTTDVVNIDLNTFSRDDLHIDLRGYDTTDELKLIGATNTNVAPGNLDEFNFDFIGADGNTYSGFARLKDNGEKDFTDDPPPIVICFAKGSEILTADGYRPIEDLRIGDQVQSNHGQSVPIRWIGVRHLDVVDLVKYPELRPVVLRRDALGRNWPRKDLYVSPQHRIQVSDWRTSLLFGSDSVLIPAKHLINGGRIHQADVVQVTYYHLLFDTHEVINANGIWSESLHPGDVAKSAMGQDALEELSKLFPELVGSLDSSRTAGTVLKKHEGLILKSYRAA